MYNPINKQYTFMNKLVYLQIEGKNRLLVKKRDKILVQILVRNRFRSESIRFWIEILVLVDIWRGVKGLKLRRLELILISQMFQWVDCGFRVDVLTLIVIRAVW